MKYLSPIDKMLKLFSLKDSKLEIIYPMITLMSLNKQCTLTADSSREDSISSEQLDNADYKVFSDGSGQDNGIGAAAVLYKKGRAHPLKSLQLSIGSPDKHNTYEAEAIGVILTLWILENTPDTIGKNVTTYSPWSRQSHIQQ